MEGCHAHFDRYYDDLLSIAEGDPKPENKREFSEFLVWSSDKGLLSNRQAEDYYNRLFQREVHVTQGRLQQLLAHLPQQAESAVRHGA